jgi:hypothetical protein
MPNYSPKLAASVLHQYVHTDKPIAQIAADHEINERDVTRIRHAAGCPSRGRRVRAIPPAMQLLLETTEQLKAAAPAGEDASYGCRPGDAPKARSRASSTRYGAEPGTHNHDPVIWNAGLSQLDQAVAVDSGLAPEPVIGPAQAGRTRWARPGMTETGGPPFSDASAIARIERLIEQELAAQEATRASLGSLARAPTEAERCARTLSTLTQTLQTLMRLRAGNAPEQGTDDDADLPADADECRNELARRIEAFLESREADEDAECAPGAATVAG